MNKVIGLLGLAMFVPIAFAAAINLLIVHQLSPWDAWLFANHPFPLGWIAALAIVGAIVLSKIRD